MNRPRRRLGAQERHGEILALLRRVGTVRVAMLARAFGVTTETARRDLDLLARRGALERTYGGGASRSLIDEPGIGIRSRAHAAERARIGAAAARTVDDGDVLMIDCGSTTSHFANALAARRPASDRRHELPACGPGAWNECKLPRDPLSGGVHRARRRRLWFRRGRLPPTIQGEQGVHRRRRPDLPTACRMRIHRAARSSGR